MNKIQVGIRHANDSDIPKINELIKSIPELNLGDDKPFSSDYELKSCLDNPEGEFLLYLKDGKRLGFLYGIRETSTTACIMYLAVLESFRNKGVGRSLVRNFTSIIKNGSISKIYAMTTNEKAKEFFKHIGLVEKAELSYLSASPKEIWDKLK